VRIPPLILRRLPCEALIWTGGLLILALIDPGREHPTFCLFRCLGFHACPGCGLGRSISFLFHGSWEGSWAAHPFGLPALLILVGRIATLTTTTLKKEPPCRPSSS
jgi:hypothetical protein